MSKKDVLAIEIGTTYSSYAYSSSQDYRKDPSKISFIPNWLAGSPTLLSLKTPTCVLIEPDGQTFHAFGYDAENKYVKLAQGGNHTKWYFFKRFTRKVFDRAEYESNSLEEFSGKHLPAKIVFALTIRYFKEHSMVQIIKRTPAITVEDVHWVLTVPDIWNIASKTFIREAAEAAGIPGQNLSIVSEPQAASVLWRYFPPEKFIGRDKTSLAELKIGTKYIVLDAGGLSTKFTVYEKLNENKVRELHNSRIDYGGTTVDEAFEVFLGEIFGKGVLSSLKDRFNEDLLALFREFESERRLRVVRTIALHIPFGIVDVLQETGKTINGCIQTSRYKNNVVVDLNKLRIDSEATRPFYENAVTYIIRHAEFLLKSPIVSDCSAIVMVGGFSYSAVLQESIQKKFTGLKVIIPEEVDLAILKGAVILGHNLLALSVERKATNLPLEILQMDRGSIGLYKQALLEGTEAIHNIRVMVVGHFGVGKTTLTKRLLGEDVNIDARESTDGIEVHVKRCKVDIESGKWTVQPKGAGDKSIYRRLAGIIKHINVEKVSSANNEDVKIHLPEKNITEYPTPSAAASKDSMLHHSETQNKGFHLPNPFKKIISLVKSLSSKVQSQQPEAIEPDTAKTAKSKEETYFETLAKELQDLPLEENANTADVSIWDFAGQYVFYDTHQVFLSPRTIYLLVTDISKTLEDIVKDDACYPDSKGKSHWTIADFAKFWLRSIHEFCTYTVNTESLHVEEEQFSLSNRTKASGPPVILVGTFADKLKQGNRKEAVDTFFSKLRGLLVENNINVAESHLIEKNFDIDNTLKTGASNIESLKKQIVETAKLQQYWGNPVPARWVTLENVITNLKSEGLKVITRHQIVELNSQLPAPIQNEDEIESFLKFHHECGNAIYYSEEEGLKENIILDPQWLIDAFKCLLTAESFCSQWPRIHKKWIMFNKTAVFDRNFIDYIWDSKTEFDFKDHKDLLLHFLEKLGLIAQPNQRKVDVCDLSNDEAVKDGNIYLAPCFLKDVPPKDVIEQTERKTTSKLCFTTASRFLPTAIFNKLLAAFIQILPISHHVTTDHKTHYRMYCGCGVFDVPNNHEMVVFFHENVIHIWLSKYSTSGEEPDNKTCFQQREFVTTFLKRHLKTVKLFVKCPEGSTYSDDMFEMEILQNQTEVVCGCRNEKHAVLTEHLTKYWCEDKTEIKINLHSHRILNTLAQRIGKEYNSLGLQLGFTQAEMDQINLDKSTVIDRTTTILIRWTERNGPKATVEELKRALYKAGIDANDVLRDLA